MTNEEVTRFTNACKENMDLSNITMSKPYNSLPLCIIDAVFSINVDYDSIVLKVVKNYADSFLKGEKYAFNHTLREFVSIVDSEGDFQIFTNKYIKYNNKVCKRLKIEVCYELAKKLIDLGINTMDDFKNYEPKEKLIEEIISVKGIGCQTVNYIFILTGDQNRIKADRHIKKYVKGILINIKKDNEFQELFTRAVEMLKGEFPDLTVAKLDHAIWKYQRDKNDMEKQLRTLVR